MSKNVWVCSFPIFDIFNIHSITALKCTWSIFDIFDMLIYTQYLMVWLKSSESQLSKTFSRLKISSILRKLLAKMCMYVLFQSSTSSTYISLQPLGVFDLSSTSLTDSITFIENENDISDIFDMSHNLYKNVCVCSFPIFNIHSITALRCIWSIFDIFNTDRITFKENENDISDIFDMSHTLYSVWITMYVI